MFIVSTYGGMTRSSCSGWLVYTQPTLKSIDHNIATKFKTEDHTSDHTLSIVTVFQYTAIFIRVDVIIIFSYVTTDAIQFGGPGNMYNSIYNIEYCSTALSREQTKQT